MGKTKWTPVIEDEIAHPLFLVLKEIIIIIIIITEIFSVIGFAFLLLARQSLYKYNSVLARSSFPFLFRFFRYKNLCANHHENYFYLSQN